MERKLYNQDEEKLFKYIDDNKEELFTQLSELVKIDTQNFRTHGKENDGQDYLEKICKEIGLTVDRFTPDSIEGLTECVDFKEGRGTDKRENLVASYNEEGAEKTIMLAAHMDTESVGDLEKWEDSPFSGLIKDGKIYGRGAGDDKSGLAVAWFLIKAISELGIKTKKNILIGSYIDEEGGGGNGALGMAVKYPCDCCVNLDSAGFETQALGGGCFTFTIKSTKNDKAIASVFDVFEGVNLVVNKLSELDGCGKTKIRLSNAQAGAGGVKEGSINIAIYTDMTKEETQKKFDDICAELKPQFDRLNLATDGFILTTRFFIYGEADKDSKEVEILSELIKETTGQYPDTTGTCLSDLSLMLKYGSKNSFNYGLPRGSADGGGAHQPNEHIYCDNLVELTKTIALLIMRM